MPDSKLKIAFHILFVISIIVTYWYVFDSDIDLRSFLYTMLLIILALAGYLKILGNYMISRFFDKYKRDPFAVRFAKGFKIVMFTGMFGIIWSAVFNELYKRAWIAYGSLEKMAPLLYLQHIIGITIIILGLYGLYTILTGLQYYTPRDN